MKKVFYIALLLLLLFSCSKEGSSEEIIAVNFPSYEVATSLLSEDKVSMLLPPGAESHHYEPTPKDMIALSKAKLIIYTGGPSDSWVESVLASLDRRVPTFRLIDQVPLLEEEEKEGMTIYEEEHEHDHEGEHEIDEHVWTSPINEIAITNNLAKELTLIYPEEASIIEENRSLRIKELLEIDSEIREVIASSSHNTLIFGSRFPFRYFFEEYGLDYYAAFPGCAEETEPSAKGVAFLIDKAKDLGIDYILDIEFGSPMLARIIAEEADAKVKVLNSIHNVTPEQFAKKENYISLMQENIEVLREVLN